jgi:hypothetical protein
MLVEELVPGEAWISDDSSFYGMCCFPTWSLSTHFSMSQHFAIIHIDLPRLVHEPFALAAPPFAGGQMARLV